MRAMNRSAFALRETSRRLLSLGVVALIIGCTIALSLLRPAQAKT